MLKDFCFGQIWIRIILRKFEKRQRLFFFLCWASAGGYIFKVLLSKKQTFNFVLQKAQACGNLSNQYHALIPIKKARNINQDAKQASRQKYKRRKQKDLNRIIQLMIPDSKQLQKEIMAGMFHRFCSLLLLLLHH